MEQIISTEINDIKYNIAQASAVDQQKLMLSIGAKIALHSAASDIEQIDKKLLMGTFLSLPEATFKEVSGIVLRKAFIAGETTPVDISAFQGSMMSLFQLVAEAVYFNLNDFFTWLDSENAARRAVNVKT